MKKPELSELAHYAEIAAAIAVVVSLIYVGRQVQDNTAAKMRQKRTFGFASVQSRLR